MIRFSGMRSMSRIQIIGMQMAVVAALLMLPALGAASRVRFSMGHYVREAGLIVVADSRRGGDQGYDTILRVTDVIKGSSEVKGTEIVISIAQMVEMHDIAIPAPATGVIVLLHPNWAAGDKCREPALAVYTKPADQAVVRRLVDIQRLPGERAQLLALRDEALTGSALMKEQLFDALKTMREPANFDIMTGLLDRLAPREQYELVRLIAETGDLRAVPALLKAMDSPDTYVRSAAATALNAYYAGAPGVTEAFEKAFARDHRDVTAARYLSLRRNDPAFEQAVRKRDTPFATVGRMWSAGETTSTRAAALALLEDDKQSTHVRRHCAVRLADDATSAEKERIRKAMLPVLTADVWGGNWLEASEAVRVLRALRHADCLEALMAMLPRTEHPDRDAARTAAMAIRELGPDARRRATQSLIDGLANMERKLRTRMQAELPYQLELLWLTDKDGLTRADSAMPAEWRRSWQDLSPLRALAVTSDEGALLIGLHTNPGPLPYEAQKCVLYRLGDLREQRAVGMLTRAPNIGCLSAWHADVEKTLMAIGGPQVEAEMLPLLRSDDKCVRKLALDALVRIQGKSSRELARSMLRDDDAGVRMSAINALLSYGTMEDLEQLLPLCDYWKADRTNHYWAMQAVAAIRARCGHDLAGPIVKK